MTHRTNIERRNRITLYMNMFYMTYGKQPSVREIGKAVGISSTSTVSGYLQRMERDGMLALAVVLKMLILILVNMKLL